MFLFVCFFKIRRPTNTTLFPYTTLFRSSMGHARALLAVDSAEHQISIAHQIVTKSLSVRDAEQMVKRSEEHTSELQSHSDLVCRLLLEKKNIRRTMNSVITVCEGFH